MKILPFWKLKLSSTQHMPPNMRVGYCGTYNASKSKWHMACVFLFYFKIFMQSNLVCFQIQMTLGVQLGLDKPMKSIFEPEENLNYFDKFIGLLYTKQDF